MAWHLHGRHQAIVWTSAGILNTANWTLRNKLQWIATHIFSFKKMHLKISSAKWRPFCLCFNVLTHWGRVTHICVCKLAINGSDNGLSPGRRQAIIWTNDGIMLVGPLGTNFSEISIVTHIFSLKKMHLKISSAKWRPFCLCLNVLRSSWELISIGPGDGLVPSGDKPSPEPVMNKMRHWATKSLVKIVIFCAIFFFYISEVQVHWSRLWKAFPLWGKPHNILCTGFSWVQENGKSPGIRKQNSWPWKSNEITRVSCQKGPIGHA